jgi:hypothetical protein
LPKTSKGIGIGCALTLQWSAGNDIAAESATLTIDILPRLKYVGFWGQTAIA